MVKGRSFTLPKSRGGGGEDADSNTIVVGG